MALAPSRIRFQRWFSSLLDTCLPARCVHCRTPGVLFCDRCIQSLSWFEAPLCTRCGRPLHKPALCPSCRRSPPRLAQIRACVRFDDAIRAAIHALKYRGVFALGAELGVLMASGWRRIDPGIDGLVPIPLHSTRQRTRGYNQSHLLAVGLSRHSGYPLLTNALHRSRDTGHQVGLSLDERRQNVAGAFVANPDVVAERHILLIDDVITTGATLDAAAHALHHAGAARVDALCLARALNVAHHHY